MSTFAAPPWPPTLDVEATRFGDQLAALYAGDHGTHHGGHVDVLGWVRWGSDYRLHRANGLSHDQAWAAIEREILRIWSAVAPPTPITGAPTRRPLVGPLRIVNKLFHDDTGPRRVFFCSWFPALRILRDNPNEFYRQLDAIAAAGYQGYRAFLAVGGWAGFWDGREVAPIAFRKWQFSRESGFLRPAMTNGVEQYGPTIDAWPDYDDYLRVLLRATRARRLRLHLSVGDMQIICPDAMREIELQRRLSRICAEAGGLEVVALAGDTNEYPINRHGGGSPAAIAQMGRVLQVWADAIPGVLTGQGADPQNEEVAGLEAMSTHGDVCITHTTRHPFDKCLKRTHALVHFEGHYRAFPKPFWQGEPAGPGKESYQALNDPASLVALYAMHALTGQASVRFQGAAVRAVEPLEAEWGFTELPALLEHLPEDVATWEHGSNRRGGIEYWWTGDQFATATWKGWDPSPPRPIASWTLYSGDNVTHGTGTPPPMTGLLVGQFA